AGGETVTGFHLRLLLPHTLHLGVDRGPVHRELAGLFADQVKRHTTSVVSRKYPYHLRPSKALPPDGGGVGGGHLAYKSWLAACELHWVQPVGEPPDED